MPLCSAELPLGNASIAYLLAGSIYGPSYISFEFALSYYGLIPEAVHVVTCASFEKKKKKTYDTIFGTFTYRNDVSTINIWCADFFKQITMGLK